MMMKKRILLALLPAAMALAACSGIQSSPKQANLMLEDTVAHEEIFGAADEIGDLRVTRMNPRRIEFAADFIKMGYQIHFDDKGDADASNDVIHIRFVAAIKDSNVLAYWHRGFAQPNSAEGANTKGETWRFKLNDGVVNESQKIYSTLTDGGTPIEAGVAGEYAAYEGFIIYTLLNIPYETYKDSYLGAFVEVVDPDNALNTKKSDFVAVKVEKATAYTSKNAFAVATDEYNGKHFLQGTINGSAQAVKEDDTVLDSSNNYASYKDLALLADDYFGSFYFRFGATAEEQHFQFFGHDGFFAESVELFDESDVLAEYVSPKTAGTHTLSISKGEGHVNHVYSFKDDANHEFTATSVPSWVTNDSAVLFAFVQHSNNVWYWVAGTFDTDHITFNAPANIKAFLLVRCYVGTTEPSWSTTGDAVGRIYNQTDNINIVADTYSYDASSWSAYNPAQLETNKHKKS